MEHETSLKIFVTWNLNLLKSKSNIGYYLFCLQRDVACSLKHDISLIKDFKKMFNDNAENEGKKSDEFEMEFDDGKKE